jgi:hypothetical protein
MIPRNERINAFTSLGDYLKDPTNSIEIEEQIDLAYARNTWLTPYHCRLSLMAISHNYLKKESLSRFADSYPEPGKPKKIGVVMAGNIPAVGFHDALCVLLSGHWLLAKLSKDDFVLMNYLLTTLIKIEPRFADTVSFVERINEADAYIATGSDNTARYFNYYFASKPHIIRKNRTSVAVLSGNESKEQLALLGEDILTYFGLGCRNVSKLYVPEGYDFTLFFESIESKHDMYAHHNKFFNNYEYNKSIVLINRTVHYDNGFLILTQNEALVSPLSVVYYESYSTPGAIRQGLEAKADKIQCVVGDPGLFPHALPYGTAQSPDLQDFADGVDTMAFLAKV